MFELLMTAAKVIAIVGACLLMSIGVADIMVFLRGAFWKNQRVCIFAAVPVEKEDALLEMKICAARSALDRSEGRGEILLLDAGADEATKRFCRNVFGEVIGADDLAECVEQLVGRKIVRADEKER